MAAKHQLITELYRRTGIATAKAHRRGSAFLLLLSLKFWPEPITMTGTR